MGKEGSGQFFHPTRKFNRIYYNPKSNNWCPEKKNERRFNNVHPTPSSNIQSNGVIQYCPRPTPAKGHPPRDSNLKALRLLAKEFLKRNVEKEARRYIISIRIFRNNFKENKLSGTKDAIFIVSFSHCCLCISIHLI